MAPAPSTQPSIRFKFRSTYKGGTKEWSTRFHFTPAVDPTNAVFDAIEAAQHGSITGSLTERTTYLGFDGYKAGSEVPVYTVPMSVACTFTPSPELGTPLECCALVRFATTQRTSKNHPIYLFQYIHDVCIQSPLSDRELLQTNQKTNIEGWAQQWVTGFTIGGSTYKKTGPYGAVAQSRVVSQYITHRDFPR